MIPHEALSRHALTTPQIRPIPYSRNPAITMNPCAMSANGFDTNAPMVSRTVNPTPPIGTRAHNPSAEDEEDGEPDRRFFFGFVPPPPDARTIPARGGRNVSSSSYETDDPPAEWSSTSSYGLKL